MKKFLAVCLSLLLLIGVAGCSNVIADTDDTQSEVQSEPVSSAVESQDPLDGLKKYTSDKGITLYMAEGYTESEVEGIDCYFQGGDSILSCKIESFELFTQNNLDYNITLEQYGQMVVDASGQAFEVKTDSYDNVYIVYEQNIDGNDFTYYSYFKKGSSAFWTCSFICLTSQVSTYEDDFALWASTIEIA